MHIQTTDGDNAPSLALLCLQPGERITVHGQAILVPWMGSVCCNGFMLTPSAEWHHYLQPEASLTEEAQLEGLVEHVRAFPCFSASSHALLTLQAATEVAPNADGTPMAAAAAPGSAEECAARTQLLSAAKSLWTRLSTRPVTGAVMLVASLRWCGIEAIEQVIGLGLGGVFSDSARRARINRRIASMDRPTESVDGTEESEQQQQEQEMDNEEETATPTLLGKQQQQQGRVVSPQQPLRPSKKARHNYGTMEDAEKMMAPQLLCDGFYSVTHPDLLGAAALDIPWSWQQMADSLTSTSQRQSTQATPTPPIVLVCGGKSVGKSTCVRYLVNTLLNSYPEVAFLDCDLGQAEFVAPGCVSLHRLTEPLFGPPYTHNSVPYRAAFIGRTSPKDDSDTYLSAIHELMNVYRRDLMQDAVGADGWAREHGIPLVINTQGWIKGLGYDMLCQQVEMLQPSHVCSLTPDPRTPLTLPTPPTTQHHLLEAPGTSIAAPTDLARPRRRFHAADLRNAQLLAGLHANTAAKRSVWLPQQPWWSWQTPLAHQQPWAVAWSAVEVRLVVAAADNPVPRSQVLWALNGTLVALMMPVHQTDAEDIPTTTTDSGATDHTAKLDPSADSELAQLSKALRYDPHKGVPSVEEYTMLGVGLLRAIDPTRQLYHIVAPFSGAQLERVTMVLRGQLELPASYLVESGARRVALSNTAVDGQGRPVPYARYGAPEGVGAVAWRVRRNLTRKRLTGGGGGGQSASSAR